MKPSKKTAKKAAKPKPKKQKGMPKGITEMTRKKHRFDGYMIRAQRKGHGFRMYVSASVVHGKGTIKQRMTRAFKLAKAAHEELTAVLGTKKYWTKDGSKLNPKALRYIKGIGFKHYEVKLKPEETA